MHRFHGKFYLKALLGVHILVIVMMILYCMNGISNIKPKEFHPKDFFLLSGSYHEERGTNLIDESNGQVGIFSCGPYTELEKGIYTVTVYYHTDSKDNDIYAFSESDEYYRNLLRGDKVLLSPDASHKTFRIWINRDLSDFEVRTDWGGGFLELEKVIIEKSKMTYSLLCMKVLCVMLLMDLCYICYRKLNGGRNRKTLRVAGSLGIIIVLASFPVCYNFLPYGTDLNFHLMRIDGLVSALKTGHFPVKIAPSMLDGYGFAVPAFYADLFLYVPAFCRMVGFTLEDAYRIYIVFINMMTCCISYWCFRRIFKEVNIGLLGSLLYTLSTYQLSIIYSGWVGIYTAYAFLPLIFYGAYVILLTDVDSKDYKHIWISMTFGLTGIIQSHVLTCEMTGIFIIVMCLLLWKTVLAKKRFLALAKVCIVTFLLNAWFLVPFLDYMTDEFNITLSRTNNMYNIQRGGISIANIFNFLQSPMEYYGGVPYGIGLALLCGGALYICCALFFSGNHNRQAKRLGGFTILLGGLALWMCTDLFPWDTLAALLGNAASLVYNIEYPWRFLGIAALFFTIATCCAVCMIKEERSGFEYRAVLMMLAVTALVTSNWTIVTELAVTKKFNAYDTYAMENYDYENGWGIQQYLPVGTDISKLNNRNPVYSERVQISDYHKKGIQIEFSCNNMSENSEEIEIPLILYKGYEAIDKNSKEKLVLGQNSNHVMTVTVPGKYQGEVRIHFTGPLYWRIAYLVTVITVIYILFILSGIIRQAVKKQYLQ